MLWRIATRSIVRAWATHPVVLVQGPRGVGKTTLVRSLARSNLGARLASLDDAKTLAEAHADPGAFVGGDDALAIDEVRRLPSLAGALAAAVSARPTPGRFLLTTSARLDDLPVLADLLAAHGEVVDLWPFCGLELASGTVNLVDEWFRGEPVEALRGHPADVRSARSINPKERQSITAGGYADAWRRPDPEQRRRWFDSYLTAVLMGELGDRSRDLAALPQLLTLIAARSGNPINVADLSRASGVPQTTVKRWVGLLDAAFLVHHVPAWTADVGRRLARSPRLFMVDTGLAAHLDDRAAPGAELPPELVTTYVVGEVIRLAGGSRRRPQVRHLRTHGGHTIDLVLQDASGGVVGVVILPSGAASARDLVGLQLLEAAVGDHFRMGVVLHGGDEMTMLAARVQAVPFRALWG